MYCVRWKFQRSLLGGLIRSVEGKDNLRLRKLDIKHEKVGESGIMVVRNFEKVVPTGSINSSENGTVGE